MNTSIGLFLLVFARKEVEKNHIDNNLLSNIDKEERRNLLLLLQRKKNVEEEKEEEVAFDSVEGMRCQYINNKIMKERSKKTDSGDVFTVVWKLTAIALVCSTKKKKKMTKKNRAKRNTY